MTEQVMRKLFIDIDETITDNSFLPAINEFLGTNYRREDIKSSYKQDAIPKERMEDFFDFFVSRDFYHGAVVYDNAIEVIKRLKDCYDVWFLTSFYTPGGEGRIARHLTDKYNFVQKYFPFIDERKLVLCCDKSIINGDIIIDNLIGNLTDNFKQKLLFTDYPNKRYTDDELGRKGIVRVNSWVEIENILSKNKGD